MALPNHFLFLLLLSFSLLHVHARDSQFFSKVTKKTEEVVQVPPKTEQQPQTQKPEQEPNFIPDTQNGYGLFGHESGQLPPSATTGTTSTPSGETFTNTNTFNNKEAYVTNSQGMSDTKFADRGYTNPADESSATTTSAADLPYRGESGESNTKNYYNNDAYVTGSQGRGYPNSATTSGYYNNDAYVTGRQGMSDTGSMDRGYTTPTTTTSAATDNNYYYYNNDGTVIDPQGYSPTATTTSAAAVNNDEFVGVDPQATRGRAHTTSTNNQFSGPTKFLDAGYTTTTTTPYHGGATNNNYNSNNQRQGMSDTRFVENGKYYYDPKGENKYNYANGYENSRRNEYNTQGYYGNNEFDQYKNSNSMEGYQNQQQEFQEEDPQEFEP